MTISQVLVQALDGGEGVSFINTKAIETEKRENL